jgi:phenylalanyl-tRNA synthetase beta chain
MRVPLSWLRDYVDLPEVGGHDLAAALTRVGLKVERVEVIGGEIDNVVVARVLDVETLEGFKKPIRWCRITDGTDERMVICGATNFAAGDVVAYARPPARLPGGFTIESRKAYGKVSDGMICSAAELGLSDDHRGILVLDGGLPLGADVVTALHLRDEVLDVAVNPDRGYALSVRGVARDAALALGVGYRDPAAVALPSVDAAGYPVRVDDVDGCSRYVARTLTGLDPTAPSPAWLQRRLTLAGMRPISLAVDVTNHVMLELGQPLHAFDRTALRGAIVVRRAMPGERLTTLDGVDRALHPDDLVITDDSGPIALAGVMGGGPTEITGSTTEIVVESARFDPVAIAYTARRHRLASEASRRYERGVDDALAPYAAEVAVQLLARLGSARPEPAVTDVDARPARPVITLDATLPGRLAGVAYPVDTVRRRLVDVGCEVEGDDPLQVTPPSWRPDLRRPVDLVEEVARLEGYDEIPGLVPVAPAGAGLTIEQRWRRGVGRLLADVGYVEVLTYPFTSDSDSDRLMLGVDDPRRATVRVANPSSEEEPLLRATLLPGLLAALTRNVSRGATDLSLFEIGSVFRDPAGVPAAPRPPVTRRPTAEELAGIEAALPDQPLHLGAVLCGQWEPAGWWGKGRDTGWPDAVQAARTVADGLGVCLEVAAAQVAPWHPGRCAELSVGGQVIGWAGELHPRVVDALALPPRTCAAEIALAPVFAAVPDAVPGPLVSAFPAASLDVALLVDASVPAAAVETALRAGAGPLLESLRLFDVFAGAQLGEGKKSLAYALRFRAADRTLSTEEATVARDAAVEEAGRRVGAVLRGA